ncbi:MAG TPA: DUF6174 domain-containing protein, partial [Roseiflexaceae bacterium]
TSREHEIAMSDRRLQSVLVGLVALTVICVVPGALALLPGLPFEQQRARQRWARNRPQRYELEIAWASDWTRGRVRAEVRDNRIIAGTDLDTGQPLAHRKLAVASQFASIDNLFEMIEAQTRPSSTPRYQIARYHPLLARWLDSCAPPFPDVRYDAELGYPIAIDYRGSPCFIGSRISWRMTWFRRLP